MKKILLAITLVFAATTATYAKKYIGIAMPETHVERWINDGKKLVSEAEALGYKAAVQFGGGDQTTQNAQISNFITQGVDLLIVGSINEGVNSVLEEAAEEGIEIISYDRLMTNTDLYNYYITFDNYNVGAMQGLAIAKGLKLESVSPSKPKYITLFSGSPTDNNARFFFDGAYDVLKTYIKRGKLVVLGPNPDGSGDPTWSKITTEGWNANIAQKRMDNLLSGATRNHRLDAILAPNDTIARAIITSLKSDSKYDKFTPIVTGQDAEIDSVKSIIKGKQTMTVFKNTNTLAKKAIWLSDQLLKGKKPTSMSGAVYDDKTYNTGKKLVKSFLLAPVTVTKANYKKELLDSGFYTKKQLK